MFSKILVLSPHTDDGEFGCGGSISKWLDEGKEVHYVAFSSAEKSVPKGFPSDILKKEVKDATKILGIPPNNLLVFNYPVRDFLAHRQEILENMVELENTVKPEIVLLPSTADTHQDHQVVSQEGFRAFKKNSIIGYEIPWNNLSFTTNLLVSLNEKQMKRKIEALKCYKSQSSRIYSSEEFTWDLARIRGSQIAVKYAEAFEAIRWIIR